MKKVLLSAAIALSSTFAFGQSINGTSVKDLDTKYIQLTAIQKGFSINKITVKVDLGQEIKAFTAKEEIMVMDAAGKKVVFNTVVDALNFFDANGFEFVTAYTVAVGQNAVYKYLLRKKE